MTFGLPAVWSSRRRFAAALALTCLAPPGLTACSAGDDSAPVSAAAANGQALAGGVTLAASSPLTGLPLEGDQASRPVLAVKIDNSTNSAPQEGLRAADMVAEELVEGGITRLAVFYQSSTAAQVGPVRSMRATDIGILQPLGASLVASGGAPQTVQRVRQAGIKAFVENAPRATGFSRAADRVAPYNLFVDLAALARRVEPGDPAPAYLPFGDGLPAGKPASGLTATFSGSSATSFAYQDGRYVNTDSNAAEGDRFTPRTVVVLRVQVEDAGYRDPAGNPVPETRLVGGGKAMIFTGGRVVRGTWSKAAVGSQVELGAGGSAMALPPGKVWIELVPTKGGQVSVRR